MKIVQIYYEQYKIPLIENFKNSQNQYNGQKGLVFHIKTTKNTGLGEAVLLEGFTNNTFQEMIWAAESFIRVVNYNEEYTFNELLVMAEIHCNAVPSVHFAIDTALYDIQAQHDNIPLSKLCNKEALSRVEFSQALISRKSTINNDVVKLKIGVHRIDDDISFLNQISRKHPSLKIRLDANQQFSVKEFESLYNNISHLKIDFFEEPIKNPNIKTIEYIKNKYPGLRYAVDESLYQKTNYDDWIQRGLIDAVVVRPSVLGGFGKFLKMIKLYNEKVQFLISSSLENSVGNMAVIHLASTIEKQEKHGINIYNFFNEFIQPPLYTKNHIDLQNLTGLGFKND